LTVALSHFVTEENTTITTKQPSLAEKSLVGLTPGQLNLNS
jgi:hypothetical protein